MSLHLKGLEIIGIRNQVAISEAITYFPYKRGKIVQELILAVITCESLAD